MSDREPDLRGDPSPAARSTAGGNHPTAAAVAVLVRDTAPQWGVMFGAFTFAFILHAGLGVGSDQLVKPKPLDVRVEVRAWTPPPPEPEPIKVPEPEPPPKPEPKPEPKKPEPKPEPVKEPEPPEPEEPPPPSSIEPPPEPPKEPVEVVAGINPDSAVDNPDGPKIVMGNTVHGDPNDGKKRDPKKLAGYTGGKPGGKAKRAKPRRVAKKKSTRAKPLERFKPRYPKQLIDEGVEGVVLLLVEVSRDGKTERIKVLRGLHPALDKLSLRAVKRFRWHPATIDGRAVASKLRYAFRWQVTS